MEDAPEHLTRWADSQLGELAWDERDQTWIGRIAFAGRLVPLAIAPGFLEPTQEEQFAVLAPAGLLLGRLTAAEPELRRLV